VFNGEQVEWAIATRVQGDRDIMIIPGARAKPLDPSLAVMPPGVVPTGAKVGIDATISEGIPRERYQRISYAYADRAKIGDYLQGKQDDSGLVGEDRVDDAMAAIVELITPAPLYYQDLAEKLGRFGFNVIARALGRLHEQQKLWQTAEGRLCMRGSKFDAKPPVAR